MSYEIILAAAQIYLYILSKSCAVGHIICGLKAIASPNFVVRVVSFKC